MLNFNLLLNKDLVKDFVTWHCNEAAEKPTAFIHLFIKSLLAIANQYRPMAEFRAWLTEFSKTIPSASPVYDKNDGWVSLAEIDEIGRLLWPKRLPEHISGSCMRQAAAAGLSLMLRLWTRRPYRQTNIRTMLLNENLYKRPHGKWAIKYASEELKVATKNNRTNYFDLPFPEDLIPLLEEYLRLWHPILIAKREAAFANIVFLNAWGKPYTLGGLRTKVCNTVYSVTGKYFHPHLIRSIFATEYISDTSDFYGAAVLLNDTIKTVIDSYAHLTEKGIAEKTDRWVHNKTRSFAPSQCDLPKEYEDLSRKLLDVLFKDTLGACLIRKHENLKGELIKNAVTFFEVYAPNCSPSIR